MSSTGVLFTSPRAIDPGGPIEYVINLNPDDAQTSLRCIGTVVRSEPLELEDAEGSLYEVAATVERYEFVRSPD
jgi:hypothetical protein